MRRTLCLTATALLGLGLLGAAPPTATATPNAAATCRGQAATIVGSDGRIRGTEGRDVVVTNGARRINTLGGDDLVCVTRRLEDKYEYLEIITGPGNDVVDGTTSPRQSVEVELGTGVDRFIGGEADDYVDAVPPGPDPAMQPDIFSGGGGDDTVGVQAGTAPVVIDNSRGRLTGGSDLWATWTGMEEFWITSTPGEDRGDLDFVGGPTEDMVVDFSTAAGVTRVDLGAGADSFYGGEDPRPGSTITGGRGRDLFYLSSGSGLLDFDLVSGVVTIGDITPYSITAEGFDDASLFASKVVLIGDNRDNELSLSACDGQVRGRRGSDEISRTYDWMFETSPGCAETLRTNGGGGHDDISGTRGNDVLRGGPGRDLLRGGFGDDLLAGGAGRDHLKGQAGNDVLKGGPGWDTADGGKGTDVCRAERTRRCERH